MAHADECTHSQAAKDNVAAILLHTQQVESGLIPEKPPAGWIGTPADWAAFTLPRPTDAQGLPWWFGTGFSPSPAAMESFEKPASGLTTEAETG